jgi:hypothetical protein
METLGVLKRKKFPKKEYINLCHQLRDYVDRGKLRLIDTPMSGLQLFAQVEEIMLRYKKLDLSDALQIVSMKSGIFRHGG